MTPAPDGRWSFPELELPAVGLAGLLAGLVLGRLLIAAGILPQLPP
jgi:hypothetical protein